MAQKFLHDITILGSDGSTATIEGAGQSTLNLKTTTNSKNNYIVGTTTGSLSFRPNGTTALTINSSSHSTFNGNVIVTDGSDTSTLSETGLVLSRSNSYIQSNADNSDTINIGQSSVRWGHVKVNSADFAVLNGSNERFKINSSGNSSFYGDLSNVGSSYTVSLSSGSNIRGSNHLFIQGDASYVQIKSNGNNIYIDGATHYFRNVAASANYLILSSTAATFSTNVTAGSNSVTAANFYVQGTYPRIYLVDTNSDDDYSIINNNGTFIVYNDTDSSTAFAIAGNNNATFYGSLTVAGADAITIPDYILHDGDNSKFGFPSNDNFKIRLGGTDVFNMSPSTMSFSGKIVPTGHIELPYGSELRTLDSNGAARTIARASSNKLQYGWSYNGAVEFMGGGSYTPRITINTDGSTTLEGQLTVGSSGTGRDVMFHGDLAGEYFHWDENVSTVNIYHRDEYPGLEVYVNGGEQTTQPQLKVGRTSAQYWGAYVDDRNAHLLHRQDETSGIMTTRFDQWDSNTSDTTGKWEWRFGDGSGSNMDHAMVLTQGGALSELTTITASGEIQGGSLDINGNADISGNLTGVDNLTINGTLSGVSTATFAGDVQILTSSGEYAVYAAADGQTALYNNGVKKFETTAVGVDVRGSLQISGDNANHVILTESGNGDFTIDAPDDIRLDAGGGDIVLRDDGSEYARLSNNSQDFIIKSSTTDKDIKFNGYDDSTEITALRLDMSDNGWAHFNGGISVGAGNSTFAGNILPSSDSSFNLGSDSVRWASIYSDGIATSTITPNTIRLNDSVTILNKTQTAYISFATRNTDGSETVLDLTNVGNITLKDYIIHNGDANTYYGFEGNDQFRVVVGGAEKLHIDSSRIRINDDLHVAADSSYDIGTSSVRFRNIYADTLYGDGSNITGITSTDNTKVAKAGDTMTGTLTVDGGGSSSVLLKTKGSARIALENANATNSIYLSNTGGNGASVLDIGGSLSIVEGGSTTFTGDIIGSGNLFLRSYNSSGKGIFFRDGFEHGDNNPYNLSITILNDGDGSADALEINAYDGIYFNTGSGTQNIRAKIGGDGNATFYGNVTLNSRLTFDYGGDHYFEAGTNSLSYKSSGGTSVMTLNALTQTATFSGIVSVPTGKTYRLYNAAGTGWGEIGLEESENKIQFNRGIKPSGNNQSDQTLGTSTKRWHTLYAGAGNFSGTLDINGTGDSTFAGPISITPPSSTGWQGLTITGSGTSHTQGAIVLKSSTTDTPEARGQGVFMFNEGDDVTWYMGTRYQDADEWQLGRKTGTSIDTSAAATAQALLKMHNSGRATFTGSVFVQSDDNDKFLVRSNDYTISRIISRGSSGADLDKGLFSLMSSDGTNNNIEKVRIDSAGNSWFNGGNVSFGNDVTIEGDLNIAGDINSTNVTNLDIDDKTITIAKGATDSAAADEAGIVVDGASASILYDHTGTKWKLNKPVNMSAAYLDFDDLNNHARIKASSSTLFIDAALIQTQGNLIPDADSSRDLGQSNRYFEDGYIETLHHKGLSPTAGSNIDQVFEFWSTNGVLTADTWTNVSGKIDISNSSETAQVFDGNIMATGTYALQMYVDDYNANGNHYGEYYSGTLSWYSSGTNSTMVDEIVMHRAGHAPNAGHIQLRTKRTASSDGKLYLQMKHSRTLNNSGITGTSNRVVKFKFRRLI